MATALASKTKTGVPKGYLSIEELAEKYPDFNSDYMTENNRDHPMRIWIDEDRPVYATISEKVVKQLTEQEKDQRRKMKATIGFHMVEDRYVEKIVQLPNRQEVNITVNDFVYLWGDPNMRFDLERKPDKAIDYVKGMSDARWQSFKVTAIDRFKRNPACAESSRFTQHGEEILPARYSKGSFDPKNTEFGLWGKIPPVYVLPPDSYGYTLKDERTFQDYVWDAVVECDLKVGKAVYKDEEIESVKNALVANGLIDDTSDLTYVRALIKAAHAKHAKTVTPEDTEV